ERLAVGHALLQRRSLRRQLGIRQSRDGALQCVDLAHLLRILLQQALVSAAEDASQYVGNHGNERNLPGLTDSTAKRRLLVLETSESAHDDLGAAQKKQGGEDRLTPSLHKRTTPRRLRSIRGLQKPR